MNIWVFSGKYNDELFASTHLTEKGALIAGTTDILEYLGVENAYFSDSRDEKEYPPWKSEELEALTSEELWGVFRQWLQRTWDHYNYECGVMKTVVQG